MDEPTQSEVHLFGRKIPQEKERKFLLVAGAVGIAGVFLLVYNQRKAALGGSVSGPPSVASGAGTSASATPTGTSQSAPLPTVELKFSESTSPIVQHGGSSSGSGSAGLKIGPFSIGGGGSKGGTNSSQLAVENTFSTDTVIQNADPGTLASVMAWITGLAGTQEQRAAQAQAEINQLYPIINPGHTIAGVTSMEQAQQAIYNTKHGLSATDIHPIVIGSA